MNYTRDIQDERKGEKHYESLARKNPKNRIAIKSMAEDEEKHKEMLEAMKRAKTKAIKKKTK